MEVERKILKAQKSSVDYGLILTTAALVIIGLIAIYDASVVSAFRDFGDKFHYIKNQLVWATLGSFSLVFFSFFDYHKLIKLGSFLLAGSIALLFLVLIPHIGTEALGARRWITFGSFNFQPSEFTKLAIIFYATAIISKFQHYKISLGDAALVYFLPILIAAGLVFFQPDFGTNIIFLFVALIIYFVGNAPIWHFLLTLPVLIFGSLFVIITEPYRLERLKAFLDPSYDPKGASYQINQIIIAIASGGLLGVGLGGSRSKFEFIPEVQNDAIFAVIVEELGFLGAIVLIALFLLLLTRAIKIAREAPDFAGKILATGLIGLVASQTFLNLASNVALVPLTGIPLPFISYGGSSLFVTMTTIGILLNIKRQS